MSEHDFEPIRGLPGKLPDGEVILWQGSPHWFRLAEQAFHIRLVAAYFAVLIVWRLAASVGPSLSLRAASESIASDTLWTGLAAATSVAPIAVVGVVLIGFLAWLNARTTVYTITNRRVVLRFGAAVPKAINIPFVVIKTADIKLLSDGSGDIALALKPPNKIAFLQLWPHARPWRLSNPNPTLRAVLGAEAVAATLADAMRERVAVETPRHGRSGREPTTVTGRACPNTVAA